MFGPLNALMGLFSHDLGIDLGTANTLVYVKNRGVVISEPSVVATDRNTMRVLAVGTEAKKMVGRTPANIVAIRPLKDGVIADFDTVQAMLQYFIGRVHEQLPFAPRPRVIVGVPSGVTEVEKRAVHEAALQSGAREVYLIEEPMAAAIGAGQPIQEASGSMIVDIGGGTTEVAVISLGGVVVSHSIRVAGDEIDEHLVNYAREEHGLLIGERTAEACKIAIGSAFPGLQEETAIVRGRDLHTGLPSQVEFTASQIRQAITGPVTEIVDNIKLAIEATPPELLADIMEHGVYLAGGGALLKGLDKRIEQETDIHVYIAENPLEAVVRGTGICLESFEAYREVFISQNGSAFG
ncbi:MAG: rod shape-determining protein [Actinobacteria bacterium]|nr:rod shape-determining protein [Actinomycetota bacterium]